MRTLLGGCGPARPFSPVAPEIAVAVAPGGGGCRTWPCSEGGGLAPVSGDEVLERRIPPSLVEPPLLWPEEEALEQMELVRLRRGTFWASERRTTPEEDYIDL